jgi:ABC-type amino acid transport system permease subunit
VPDDGVTLYGVIIALSVVALVLAFLVALSFCLGTMLRNAMLATAVLVFVWLPANVALDTFSLKEFSPLSLSRSMPSLLRTPWHDDGSVAATGVPSMKELQAMAQIFGVIGGGVTPVDEPEGKFFQQGDYRDFPLVRVVLGYSLSTLLAFGLSLLFFCWRDL